MRGCLSAAYVRRGVCGAEGHRRSGRATSGGGMGLGIRGALACRRKDFGLHTRCNGVLDGLPKIRVITSSIVLTLLVPDNGRLRLGQG